MLGAGGARVIGLQRADTLDGMNATLAKLLAGLVLASSLVGSTSEVLAQNFGQRQEDHLFRIESTPGQRRGGRPIVSGYVYNNYGSVAAGVRLVVEQLDAAGQVTASTGGWVGMVPNMGRTYFEVPMASTPGTYRVRITAYEWVQSGGDFM
jgi:hypothetical protein